MRKDLLQFKYSCASQQSESRLLLLYHDFPALSQATASVWEHTATFSTWMLAMPKHLESASWVKKSRSNPLQASILSAGKAHGFCFYVQELAVVPWKSLFLWLCPQKSSFEELCALHSCINHTGTSELPAKACTGLWAGFGHFAFKIWER